jgi:hypothetical protein
VFNGKQWMVVAYYSSYLAAGESFAAQYLSRLGGITDPSKFISAAQAHGYSGDSTSSFLSIEGGIENCLRNGN